MTKLMIAALAATTAFATPAFASSTTSVTAEVPAVCSLTAPGSVSVATSGLSDLGTANLICNSASGFTIHVSSQNGGFLADHNGPSTTHLPYTLSVPQYGVSNLALTTADMPINPGAGAAPYVIGGLALDVKLNVGQPTGGLLYAGTYTDVITYSINAN
jgi:hypothetical protein